MLKTLYLFISLAIAGGAMAATSIQPESGGVEVASVAPPPIAKASKPSEIIDPTDPRAPKLPKDVEVVNRLLSVTSTITALLLLYDVLVLFYNVIFPHNFRQERAEIDKASSDAMKEYQVRIAALTSTDYQGAARIGQILNQQQNRLQLNCQRKIDQRLTVVERQCRCMYNQMIVVPTTVVLRHPALRVLAVASYLYTLRDQWQQSWFRASINSIHLTATLYRDLRLWWYKRHNRGASDIA